MIRIAAVGDVHIGKDSDAQLLSSLGDVGGHADVLLLAGDLTQHGGREEAKLLVRSLESISIPVIAVLGNHDYHRDEEDGIRADLERAGVVVLEGGAVEFELSEARLGIAGVKGFGGGFAGACATDFGEKEMKDFIRHTRATAERFQTSLEGLSAEVRVGLTHYSPTETTLLGEKLEIFPFLGSYLLAEAIDGAECHLAIHGHAHHGIERGVTPGGVPVRNVARPVIQRPYKVYCLSPSGEPQESCGPS